MIKRVVSEKNEMRTNYYYWGLDLSGTLQGAGGVGGLLATKLGTNEVRYTYMGQSP